MSFKEFKLLKSALPKPKLFNVEFIISQQNKLNEFRSQLRQIPKEVFFCHKNHRELEVKTFSWWSVGK